MVNTHQYGYAPQRCLLRAACCRGNAVRLARFPNVGAAVPHASDWAKISNVSNHTIGIAGVTPAQLAAWKGEMAGGNGVWMHGLWDWNWARATRGGTNPKSGRGQFS